MRRLFVVAALVTLIFSACQPQPRNGVEAPSTTRALSLEITAPLDGRETAWGFVTVTGIVSSPEAQVNVSGINVDVGQDGSFESDYILLDEGKNKLTAVATLEGKTVSKTVTVTYTLKLHVSISLNLERGKDWLTESPTKIGGRVSDPRAEVIVNGKKAEVGKDGSISAMLNLTDGKNQIIATARLRDQIDTDTREAIYVPPVPLKLNIASPTDGGEIGLDLLRVTGTVSDPEALITVNNIKALVTAAGAFYAYVELESGENRIDTVVTRGSENMTNTIRVTYNPVTSPVGKLALELLSPRNKTEYRVNVIPVTGVVGDPQSMVLVDGREAVVSTSGTFQGYVVLDEGKNVIEVVAFKDALKTIKNIEVSFAPPLVVLLSHSSSARVVDYRKEPATFTGMVNKPEAQVTVDGKSVPVAPDGSFAAQVFLSKSSSVKAVATLGDERDETYILTGVGDSGAILTVPGYSIFFRARLEHEHAITLEAGETGRLPLKLETRKDGPGRFSGSLVYVEQEYGRLPLAWPQGLDVYLEPGEFMAYPNTTYDFDLVFKTTPELAPGTYYVNFYQTFENGFRASSSIKVTVE